MTTTNRRPDRPNRHSFTSRKDFLMLSSLVQCWLVEERQSRLRAEAADLRRRSPARPLRHRLGESLIRLGRQIGGNTLTAPAWQG